jgi:integral membrane protein
MLKTVMGRLRVIGLFEGLSFLVLLLIAMPLKYWADIPEAVAIVGGLHGALFVLYMLALLHVWITYRWSIFKVAAAFIAAFLPLGTFVLDKKLLRDQV